MRLPLMTIRRWMIAVALVATIPAAAGVMIWYLVPPAKYTAQALLHIAMNPQRINGICPLSSLRPFTVRSFQTN